jgi:hypothetical protein
MTSFPLAVAVGAAAETTCHDAKILINTRGRAGTNPDRTSVDID